MDDVAIERDRREYRKTLFRDPNAPPDTLEQTTLVLDTREANALRTLLEIRLEVFEQPGAEPFQEKAANDLGLTVSEYRELMTRLIDELAGLKGREEDTTNDGSHYAFPDR